MNNFVSPHGPGVGAREFYLLHQAGKHSENRQEGCSMKEKEDQYNECVICGNKEFTAGEPIKKYVCNSCYEAHRDEVAHAEAE